MRTFLLLLLLGVTILVWAKIIITAPRAWRRRKEGGFWAAWKAVALEDRERYRQSQLAKKAEKAKPHLDLTPATDYDPKTGEVYGDGGHASKSRAIERWEASLVQIWSGSEDVEFTYESRSGKVRRKVTVQTVLRNETFSTYLRGFCHVRNEERTFSTDSICTKILVKGKRYDVEDFLSGMLGISDDDLGWT
ncbi:hypothetical protein dsx2_2478 [Desulfovibrio sp. X2]|uniref:WYL domain-containing protein n=1 Tax=Desulfovibrio sp. X2 TaxID=941449 RepID=UPI000358E7E1|nr:hypothetical protein [Desulfovibrio sp. X2]EPR43118.1 hypothetical protein dsx2_2478 [Desulfovibrio sp. X2]